MLVAQGGSGYRLPRTIDVCLTAAARELRNAEAVMRLAVFLGRFHTAPGRLGRAFPVDRIALATHDQLGLTEARVRGALMALERIGFVVREVMPGSAYRATEHGLHRRPIMFRFAPEFMAAFEKANAAALRARGAGSVARRPLTPSMASRPSTASVSAPTTRLEPLLAKKQTPAVSVSFGDQSPATSESGLEAALARLRKAVAEDAA